MESIADFREVGYQVPRQLRAVLTSDPNGDPWAAFSAATSYARAGFRVLPCVPGDKDPLDVGQFQHAANSASRDYETVRDAFLANPEANVAIAPDSDMIIVDIDPRHGGSLEQAERLHLDVSGYRERTPQGGFHVPLVMPAGILATCSAELAPGIELKGPGSYVLSPHSRLDEGLWPLIERPWYQPEIERGVWAFGRISPSWEHLAVITRERVLRDALLDITLADEVAAREIERRLLTGSQAAGICALFSGDWPDHYPDVRDTSESMRDYLYVLAGSHFVRHRPRAHAVLAALLLQTGWPQSRTRRHPKKRPEQYVQRTVAKALEARAEKDGRRLDQLRVLISLPASPVGESTGVFDPKIGIRGKANDRLIPAILRFSEIQGIDEYTREEGWRRFPVADVARLEGVSEETVRLALKAAQEQGLIERKVVCYKHDGRPRRDSLIRSPTHLQMSSAA